MKKIEYLHLMPNANLQEIPIKEPFAALVIIEEEVSNKWRSIVSEWLVDRGCLFMMAWGKDCSLWDDSVDWANLEKFDYKEIPEDKFVMTSWHGNETLDEVFWFAQKNANHPNVSLEHLLLVHITRNPQEKEMLQRAQSFHT